MYVPSMSENTPPINHLPPENLIEIFSFVQARGVELVRKEPYPWRLSLVCRLWRDIISTTPQLWATITIDLDPVHVSRITTRHKALVSAWNTCLERSRGYPLKFSLQADTTDALAFMPSFMTPCINHASHWGTAVLDAPIDVLLPFISDPNLQYPHLRSLVLRSTATPTEESQDMAKYTLFGDAPLLSKLVLQEFPYRLAKLRLPWSQITNFSAEMNAGEVSDLLEVLRYMSNLISLQFHKYHGEERGVQATQILEFPHLRKLSWLTYMVDHSLFFDSIYAPRLEEIELQVEDANWDHSFHRFLSRSRCKINSIRLGSVSAELASSILELVPDVESASFWDISAGGDLVRALTFDNSKPRWIGPNLKRVVLEDMWALANIREELVCMINSRLHIPNNSSARRLESLHILVHSYHNVPVPLYPLRATVFQPLKQQFLPQDTISITYEERSSYDRW